MKKEVKNKIFIIVFLFLILGATNVFAASMIINENGIRAESYYTSDGNQGITQNISYKDNNGDDQVMIIINGIVVNATGGTTGGGGSEDWWNSNWNYKKQIDITDSVGVSVPYYSILLNIAYDSDMQSDFDDLRFVNADEDTELGYWIENKTDSTEANVWVKLPVLEGGTDTTIYMYYGNSGASTTSNSSDAFILYDDFDDLPNDWTTPYRNPGSITLSQYATSQVQFRSTGVSGSASECDIATPSVVSNQDYILQEWAFVTSFDTDDEEPTRVGMVIDSQNSVEIYGNGALSSFRAFKRVGGSYTSIGTNVSFTDGDVLSIARAGDSFKLRVNGLEKSGTTQSYGNTTRLWIASYDYNTNAGCIFDWVRVRGYTTIEPSYNILTEQSQ